MTGAAFSSWLTLGRGLSAKSALLLLTAWALTLAMRRSSAAARHLVWLLAFAGLLALPLLSVTLPQHPVPVLPQPAAPLALPPAPVPPDTVPVAPSAPPRPVHFTPARARLSAPPDWPRLFGLLWLGGVAVTILPLGAGWLLAARRIRHCLPVTDPAVIALAADARRQIGVPRPVALRSGPGIAVPVTLGLFRPVVLLPEAAHAWPAERLRVALLHEFAHVRRGDWAAQTGARLVCALYWHNPLVWAAARLLRAEAERACDDLVLAAGVPAPDYARHLLAVAQALSGRPRPLPLAVPMAGCGPLESRLRAVLAARPRRAPSRRLAATALLLALGVLVPLATLRPAARAARQTVRHALLVAAPLPSVILPSLPPVPAPSLTPLKAIRPSPAPPPVHVPPTQSQPTPRGVPPMKPPTPIKTAALAALAAGLALPAAQARPTVPVKHAPTPTLANTRQIEAVLKDLNARTKAAPPLIDFATQGNVTNGVGMLFQGSHKSYVIEPGVSGSVKLDLHSVPFDKALSTLVGANSEPLEWSVEAGVYHIRPRATTPEVFINAGGPGDPIRASNPLVSLDLKKVPIRQALDSLFTAAKANYSVAAGVPDEGNTVTIHVTNVPLVFALDAVLAASATPLLYTIQQGSIFVITPKRPNPFETRSVPPRTGNAANPFAPSLLPNMRFAKPDAAKAP